MISINAYDYFDIWVFLIEYFHLLKHLFSLICSVLFRSKMNTHQKVDIFSLFSKIYNRILVKVKLVFVLFLKVCYWLSEKSFFENYYRSSSFLEFVPIVNKILPFNRLSLLNEHNINILLSYVFVNYSCLFFKTCVRSFEVLLKHLNQGIWIEFFNF